MIHIHIHKGKQLIKDYDLRNPKDDLMRSIMTAKNKGSQARRNKVPVTQNPYSNDPEKKAWIAGWNEADKMVRDASFCTCQRNQ